MIQLMGPQKLVQKYIPQSKEKSFYSIIFFIVFLGDFRALLHSIKQFHQKECFERRCKSVGHKKHKELQTFHIAVLIKSWI